VVYRETTTKASFYAAVAWLQERSSLQEEVEDGVKDGWTFTVLRVQRMDQWWVSRFSIEFFSLPDVVLYPVRYSSLLICTYL
jgi:hypothetical protein